jgi:hypothetical protein
LAGVGLFARVGGACGDRLLELIQWSWRGAHATIAFPLFLPAATMVLISLSRAALSRKRWLLS